VAWSTTEQEQILNRQIHADETLSTLNVERTAKAAGRKSKAPVVSTVKTADFAWSKSEKVQPAVHIHFAALTCSDRRDVPTGFSALNGFHFRPRMRTFSTPSAAAARASTASVGVS